MILRRVARLKAGDRVRIGSGASERVVSVEDGGTLHLQRIAPVTAVRGDVQVLDRELVLFNSDSVEIVL